MQAIYEKLEKLSPEEMESVYFYVGDKLGFYAQGVDENTKKILDEREDDYEKNGARDWEEVRIDFEKKIYA